MEIPTYESAAKYSAADIEQAMRNAAWVYDYTGYKTSRAADIQSMMLAENDAAYKAAMMEYENWYNSPTEQLRRDSDAGVGTSQPEKFGSATADSPTVTPSQPTTPITTALSAILQGYQFVVSATSQMLNLKNSAFDSASRVGDLALSQIVPLSFEKTSSDEIPASYVGADKIVGDFMRSLPSSYHRKVMRKHIDALINSPTHERLYYGNKKQSSSEKFDFIKLTADDKNQGTIEQIFKAYNDLSKIYYRSVESAYKSQSAKSEFDTEFYENSDGVKAANSVDYNNSLPAVKEGFINQCQDYIKKEFPNISDMGMSLINLLVYFFAAKLDSSDMGSGIVNFASKLL